jgi:hypothetical protein
VVFEYQVIRAMGREYGQPALALPYCPQGDESYYALALISALQLMPWIAPDWQSDRVLRFRRDHQDLYTSADLVANVAVLWSRNTRDFFGSATNDAYVNQVACWVVALARENIPCRVVSETALPRELSTGCRVLLAPEAACLSDDSCAAILRFAEQGGTVVVTPSTCSHDETGCPREGLPFRGFFGPAAGEEWATWNLGQGTVHRLGSRPTDLPPSAARKLLDTIRLAAGDELPMRAEDAPDGLFATLARTPDGQHVLHLVNLRWREDGLAGSMEAVSFHFAREFGRAVLLFPEQVGARELPLAARELRIPVRETGMYAVVVLT